MKSDPANPSTTASATLRTRRPTPKGFTDFDLESSERASAPQLIPLSSNSSSRAISPVPGRRNQYQDSRIQEADQRSLNSSHRTTRLLSSQNASLWETSWSSLQGIASSLFSAETSAQSSGERRSQRSHQRPTAQPGYFTRPYLSHWGPTGGVEKEVGKGSKEDRLAQLQAKKRETLLQANGNIAPNALGQFKRRDSDERRPDTSPSTHLEDKDALVYIHHVKPEDTLAGVTIKYNCHQNAFRKANRLWPNDSIQIRKVVVLPVDACGVKGRKLTESEAPLPPSTDYYDERSAYAVADTQTPWFHPAAKADAEESHLSSMISSPAVSVAGCEEIEPPWKHDSWVTIDGFTDAVEIARLSRRTLGYFPPSRRKSQPRSDAAISSLDLPRISFQNDSPQREKSRSSSNSNFLIQLHGPGGVGTLGRGARGPGPAQDGLNKMFAAHLPNVAPRASFDSTHSNASAGLENVGGAIEGWVRKVANKAVNSIQASNSSNKNGPMGDLIELTPAAEGLDVSHENNRGRSQTTGVNQAASEEMSLAEQEQMLRERFPPTGRIFRESSRRNR